MDGDDGRIEIDGRHGIAALWGRLAPSDWLLRREPLLHCDFAAIR
jgi:hypothetical protein